MKHSHSFPLPTRKKKHKQHKLRSEIAGRLELPPYNVLGAQVLRQLAVRRPVDLATLPTVDGMSEKKVADYGAEIIAVR